MRTPFAVDIGLAPYRGTPARAERAGYRRRSAHIVAAAAFATLAASSLAAATVTRSRDLSFEDRVACQTAIEEVYWRHRIWPKENPRPRPAFAEVMPRAAVARKVEGAIAMSAALDRSYGDPIEPADLQGELDRMARSSRNPTLLAELFAALGNDATLAAECLARPALAERRLRGYALAGRGPGALGSSARVKVSRDRSSPAAASYELPLLAGPACTGDAWQTPAGLSSQSLGGRQRHTAVWTGTEMVVWGGRGGSVVNTGARYNPATDTWSATSLASAPTARENHTAVWTGTEMVVWGGNPGGGGHLNTGGRYNPATDTWSVTSVVSAPSGRVRHTVVWTGKEMVVWGGDVLTSYLNTGGRYNPVADSWTATSLASVPSARSSHSAVWTGSEMVVWGGEGKSGTFLVNFSSGGRYNPTTDSWVPTSLASVPIARYSHSAVWTGSAMVVWGGISSNYLNSGGRYYPATDSWAPMSLASAPNARVGETAVWTGLEMVVWGGINGVHLDTGGRYNPSADRWVATSVVGAPSARFLHTAVWTGAEMIVWGGTGGTSVDDTGGRYNPCSPGSPANPLDHFGFSVIPSPQSVGSAFSVTITALDAAGARVYADADLSLTASLGRVSPLQVHLANGVATVPLVLDGPGQGIVLAAFGGGVTGESNPFEVTGGTAATGTLAGVVVAQGPSVTSKGSVHSRSAAPAAGATVTLTSSDGTDTRVTNASGEYMFSGKPCKSYSLYATYAQSTTPAVSVRIPCSSTTTADLVLASCPTGVTPILFIPGILGSTKPGAWITPELPASAPSSYFGPEWGVWSDNLLLNQAAGLHDPLGAAGWRDLAASLEQANPAYLTGCTIVPVPWDWRMPLDQAMKKYLIPAIADAKQTAHSAKVHIVAHSMGGLLARAYIQSDDYASRNDVDKLALVGTPNLGAANAFLMWQGGDPQTADLLAFNLLGDWFSKLKHVPTAGFYTAATQGVSRVLRGRPVLVDPSSSPEAPQRLLTSDVADLYHTHIQSMLQLEPTWAMLTPRGALACPAGNGPTPWTNTWLNELNAPSASRARMVPQNGDPTKVRTKVFAGTGQETVFSLPAGAANCSSSLFPDGKPLVVPSADPAVANYYSLGDGTVPLFSAYPSQLGAVMSFFQPARSGEHSGLIGTYKCDIVSFLLGNVSCPASAPALAAASAAGTLSVAVAGRPRPYLSAPGGAASGIDPATGARETGIAGSSVTMQADSGVITVPDPADGTYSVALSSAYAEDYELQLTYLAEGGSESTEVTAFYSGPATINFTFSSVGSPKINILHGPAPPTGLQAEAFSSGGRQTRLSWNAHPDPQVTGFNIYSKLAADPKLAKIGSTTDTTFLPDDPWADDAAQPVRVYAISAHYSDGTESFLSPVVLNDDRDHDGITDVEEAVLGTNPDAPDTDGDGLSDAAEIRLGTSPVLTDTDGDGIGDDEETARGSDPLDPAAIPGLAFFTVAPCRLVDTRRAEGPTGGPALQSGATRLFAPAGTCGIPATARALSVNITMVQPTNAGYVSLFPGGIAAPLASTLNFATGQTRANNAVVRLSASASRTLAASAFVLGSGHVDLLIDVTGYFDYVP